EYDSFVQNYNMHSMGKTVNELHAMLKLHEQTLPKRDAPALHAIRAGKKRNCPQYLSELLKNKKLSQGASISGFRRSRKLKPRALSLYMDNGQRAAVEAIGSYDLCFPSGLVIVLHNCHYAPTITRGVISVSRLYDDDSKRRAFWSLNEDILKIPILKTNTPYPSRKIRRIRANTHQRPRGMKINTPYPENSIRRIQDMESI
ncbi:hypothetical protein Tco_1567611, partial [Tanacetum coccineum]